jgi:hypothetical protein
VAVQSIYNIVELTVTSTWLYERRNPAKKMLVLRDDLQWRPNEVCPLKMTMSGWERKLFFDELVSKTGKGLRSRPNIMKSADVAALLLRSPKKWLWKGSSKLGVCENVRAKPFYNPSRLQRI